MVRLARLLAVAAVIGLAQSSGLVASAAQAATVFRVAYAAVGLPSNALVCWPYQG